VIMARSVKLDIDLRCWVITRRAVPPPADSAELTTGVRR
jgi:hypothetical protein